MVASLHRLEQNSDKCCYNLVIHNGDYNEATKGIIRPDIFAVGR